MSATNLIAALVAAKAEMPDIRKTATNPHFGSKFVPLDEIVEKITPVLGNHGLAWMTFPTSDEHGRPALRYVLAHESGEVMEDTMPLCLGEKVTPQAQGSALSYARRYAAMAVLDLAGNDDDDGHSGSQAPARSAPRASGGSQRKQQAIDRLDGLNDPLAFLAGLGVSAKTGDWTPEDVETIHRMLDGLGKSDIPNGLDPA